MYLDKIQSAVGMEFRKIDPTSRKENTRNDNTTVKKSDKTSLSSEARSAVGTSATVKVLASRVEAQPDIRQDRVEAVRARVENGFYNSRDFADSLADRLIGDLGF